MNHVSGEETVGQYNHLFWQLPAGAGPPAFLNTYSDVSCSAQWVGRALIFNLHQKLVEITISKGTSLLVFAVLCQL